MRTPQELSREELEQLAETVQEALYLDHDPETGASIWDPDKEWSGFDVCAELAGALAELEMVPEDRTDPDE